MSDFDRNTSARWGQGATRAGRAEIDQGLRSYMLGVYNNMVVGLALTGVVALGAAAGAVIVTICLGLLGTWRVLGRKPGPYLRDL